MERRRSLKRERLLSKNTLMPRILTTRRSMKALDLAAFITQSLKLQEVLELLSLIKRELQERSESSLLMPKLLLEMIMKKLMRF